jgi:Zn-dependent protease with chaperone function
MSAPAPTPSAAPSVLANYFDGKSARPCPVRLGLYGTAEAAMLVVHSAGGETVKTAALNVLEISEPMGRAPRTLRFTDGSFCEVPYAEQPALQQLLACGQIRESLVVRLQQRWRTTLLALLLILACIAASYLWGLPWLAKVTAPHLPERFITLLSESSLQALDRQILKPSKLPHERQQAIAQALDQLEQGSGAFPAHRLHFRSAPAFGPNAFALPSGDIVIFDELVTLARNDQDIAAVLAHELGHVAHHHGMRQLIQGTVVSVVAGAYLGDISSLAGSLGTLLLQSNYSRDFEREADRYAGQHLLRAGLGVAPMVYMLSRLEASHRNKAGERKTDKNNTPPQPAGRIEKLLTSHPETAERIARLEQQAARYQQRQHSSLRPQ